MSRKAILEISMPDKCLSCPVAWYETGDDGERLLCLPLSEVYEEDVDGEFLKRRDDCPLKGVD